MDSADRDRIGEDLKLFKVRSTASTSANRLAGREARLTLELRSFTQEYISNLKFAYLESCAKLEFVNHILDADGYKPIPKEENDQLGASRLSTVSSAPSSRLTR